MKRMAALLVTIGICGCMSACNTEPEPISFDVTNDVLGTQLSRSPITSTSESTTTSTTTGSKSSTTTTTTTRVTTTTRKTTQSPYASETEATYPDWTGTVPTTTTTTAAPVSIAQWMLYDEYMQLLILEDDDPHTDAIRGYQVLQFLAGHWDDAIYRLGYIYEDKIPSQVVYQFVEPFFVLDDAMKESLKDTRYYNSDTDTYSRFSRSRAFWDSSATIAYYKPLGDDCYEVYGNVYNLSDSIYYKVKVKLTFAEEGYRESIRYLTAEAISGEEMALARETAYEYDPEAELKRE